MRPIFRWLTSKELSSAEFTPKEQSHTGFASKEHSRAGFPSKDHPRAKQALLLAGYNGHGVALSVYLGKWAAQALLARRPLPRWH
jgi:glycine/D-amino acid oxidase-like deaminating enzyme